MFKATTIYPNTCQISDLSDVNKNVKMAHHFALLLLTLSLRKLLLRTTFENWLDFHCFISILTAFLRFENNAIKRKFPIFLYIAKLFILQIVPPTSLESYVNLIICNKNDRY